MIPGWGRSSWRVPGRTPKLSRSSASVIGPTRVWCSCGQEAGTPRLAWHSSNTPGYRSSTRRTNWPEACRAASAYHTWRERRLADGFATAPSRTAVQDEAIAQALGLGRPTLSESESKQLLAAWGVGSARERRANSAEAAVEAAEQLGFPVALKVDSPDIPHKTEAGVVRLNLGDAAQVRTAYAEILASAKSYLSALPLDGGGLGGGDRAGGNPFGHRAANSPPPRPSPLKGEGADAANAIAPQARITGVSVQEMVGEGVEVIIGVSCDPQLGPVLLFGSGGVMVEVYNDVALRRCPITRSEAQAMIAEVKGARLLQGFRGRPAADLEALADTLVRVSYLAMHLEGHLAELDINPLMVLPRGQGVKAVDALVVFRGTLARPDA